jgi:hypothetical protein
MQFSAPLKSTTAQCSQIITDSWYVVQWGDTEIVALCNSKDSAHIVANFDTLPSARKFLFIHEILGTKSLLGWKHVYQISKLEDWY